MIVSLIPFFGGEAGGSGEAEGFGSRGALSVISNATMVLDFCLKFTAC